jgi:hypothetical protein
MDKKDGWFILKGINGFVWINRRGFKERLEG